MRLAAMQTCPALVKLDQNSCSATFLGSASGSTIEASLPPSSSVMRFKSFDAPSMIRLPVAVDPVKVILSISGWPVISGPNESRSEEHTSELQSLMRISYAVFCLKKKKHKP